MRTKSIEATLRDAERPGTRLNRSLGPLQLTMMGIGVTIGGGIFVLTGTAAANYAGPAIALSFALGAFVSGLVALCYMEFASTVPVAGSAYTFAYLSLGEPVAWLIGWDLILDMTMGAGAVAAGWSQYVTDFLATFGIRLPESIAGPEAAVNVPAVAVILVLTAILAAGVRTTSRLNVAMTLVKLAAIVLFLAVGVSHVDPDNWAPFVPEPRPAGAEGGFWEQPLLGWAGISTNATFGFAGILTGAAIVFGSYSGFDIMASSAEEAKRPQRTLPIALMATVAACATLYVTVSLVVTGMRPYTQLDNAAPVTGALEAAGEDWAVRIVGVGAICGLTTVVMIMLLGQSRVFLAMSRDRLLPGWFARVHPVTRSPRRITWTLGCMVALMTALLPIQDLAELGNIGMLTSFIAVCVGVIYLRRRRPDLPRAFRTPWVPVLPLVALVLCLVLVGSLPLITWARFLVWMAVGVLIYLLWGRHNSRVATGATEPPGAPDTRGATATSLPDPADPVADPRADPVADSSAGEGASGEPGR
ncbi:amino acid permease [Streptomyces diacarni]|uniref:Amino acid permease n=1 Tax=Streptomyces diacarni TaxID=2800381 RepID=A0A367EVG5_9ACTN|nr:amino acid permease [Streptomyces diacarni]RCG22001.1 amino acid permease [Streptomyces diacarni]